MADALSDSRDLHDTISARSAVLESLIEKVDDAAQTAADIERLVYVPSSKREKAWALKAMDVGGAANPYRKYGVCLEASSDFNAYVTDVQHALRTGASRPGTITARGWRPAQACSSRLSRLVR
ncbi:hypothetical protein N7E70_006045 [Aminobacter sp. NyZ550]|uniref:Uncharacterized protein n=1 Tax=Aminobacter aminovorans TaxID=83263 RepID=A0AAC9AQD7_AMIAI|nr:MULTISPECIES: hypothetical protein [Aminobacter]AMS40274.1 hypothetical protein AA2016_1340 [Aminobacter aminovorans]MBB3710016.1 hypothetical protein [Aminobacter aminovorans]WAX96425.1 hypothetical protein N7E70_006045 [Aminobacter sp. NyZ550]